MDSEVWISHSKPSHQIALSAACVAMGWVLLVGFRHFSGLGSHAAAGFFLGLLLLLLGLAGWLVSGQQTVVVDPRKRCITIEDSNRFGTTRKTILFKDIADVGMGFLGKKMNRVEYYYLLLRLRDGQQYSLFPPGRCYEGASSRATVAYWRQRLEDYIRQPSANPQPARRAAAGAVGDSA